MGVVREIGHHAADREASLEVLRELLLLAARGELMGFSYMAQIRATPAPYFGALGCYRTDPWRGLATLERMRGRLTELAEDAERREESAISRRY